MTVRVRLPASARLRVAILAVFANVIGLIVFLQTRADRLLAAVVDPLHPDWMGMERAFTGFTIYAASLLGALIIALLLVGGLALRAVRPRKESGAGATVVLAATLTALLVLVFIEVLIFQDYGIHFYEFDVFGILADAALRRDLGIQPAEVARVTGAAVALLGAEVALCAIALRFVSWRNGALPRACGTAMLVAIPGGLAMFSISEDTIGPARSEFEGALPLGRQLLMRSDARPHIAVEPRTGPGGYPVLTGEAEAPRMARRQNIVFHVPDGLRADMVRPELTPHILGFASQPDVLASGRHFSTGHVSEAGIFGLLYGLNSHAFNAFIGDRIPAYPIELLKRNGYHTFFISSSRLNPYPSDQLISMFDEVVYPADDDAALDELRRYVRQRREDGRPYFILSFFYTPHFPFTSAKPHLRKYPLVGPKARPNYMNDVIQADDFFRLALESLAPFDSTIVLVTSDHGEEIRDHGMFGHASATFWNEKVQVPFFLKLPGRSVRNRRVTLSSHVDVWPTILDHLGVSAAAPAASYSDGRSLLDEAAAVPVVVNGRFFPFADRPSAVIDEASKTWFRADRMGRDGKLCLEAFRVTDLHDRELEIPAPGTLDTSRAFSHLQRSFSRFLRYAGPQTAPCALD